MFKVEKNPIDKLENSLDLMSTLLRYNHAKKGQCLIISLGMDEEEQSYTIDLIFKDQDRPEMNAGMKISAPIVSTDGFTPDNAKIALRIFIKYYEEIRKDIQGYVNYTWSDYNFSTTVIAQLPDISQKYFKADVIQKINKEKDKNLESLL